MSNGIKRWADYHKKILISAGIISGLILFGSWYLVSYLFILLKAKTPVTNPILFFGYFKRFGFPWLVFLFFAFLGLFFVGTTLIRQVKGFGRMDPDRNIKYSKADTYGSAGIATAEDIVDMAQCQHINEALGPIYGRLDNTVNKVINMNRDTRINRHMFVLGASQSGKTFCYVLPSFLQVIRRRESLIVTDPKGELYETTAEYAKKMGYAVRRFDLRKPELSDGWDCLKEILRDGKNSAADRAAIFADIVIKNTGSDSGGDPIFTEGPKMLLKALLLRVALGSDLKEQNFAQIVNIIKSPNVAKGLEALFQDESSMPYDATISLAPYYSYKNASEKLAGNLIIDLGARLQAFDSPTVKKVMSTDDIDMTLPGKQPCVYYVMMSDMHGANNFLGALFFSYLFLDLVEFADSLPKKRCPIPVNFLLDEFANIGSIPDFDKKMAVIRSRGLYVSIILQDIPQLRNRYPHTADSIMSNCGSHLCIGFNDRTTEEEYSARSGETTVQVQTDQHKADESIFTINRNHSTGDGRRAVFSPDELARLSLDECLLVLQSKDVMKLQKFPVNQHPEYKNLVKCSANNYPSIFNTKAREELRRKEKEYIAEFNNWLLSGGDPFPYVKRSAAERQMFVDTAKPFKEEPVYDGFIDEETRIGTIDVSDLPEVFDLDELNIEIKEVESEANNSQKPNFGNLFETSNDTNSTATNEKKSSSKKNKKKKKNNSFNTNQIALDLDAINDMECVEDGNEVYDAFKANADSNDGHNV